MKNPKSLTLEDIQDFRDFLTGDSNRYRMTEDQPKLTKKSANWVIWYLQEIISIIPHKFRRCDKCAALYEVENKSLDNICPICGHCHSRDDRR